ncbi:MAG: 1-acyl-sn-glycerol-3-phosphate acyltransferase [Clostridium sp.]|nr:1-acyl-sn-glycerol-3-phosphate acyltransferase [Clostridium sp.]
MREEVKELSDEELEDDAQIFHMWEPLNFDITDDYKYICHNWIFNIISSILTLVIYPILYIFNKVFLGFKIENKEKLQEIKGGKVTISNHIHPLDCTMNGIINFPSRVYFPTLSSNFKIPIVRHLIRILYAIPIPSKVSQKEKFLEEINKALKNEKTIHMYPEGALWPYCDKIRKFKNGAFKIAVKADVPIVPILYVLKEAKGIYKLYKKKKCIHAIVLDPIYPNKDIPMWQRAEEMKERAHKIMDDYKNYIDNNS